MTRAQPIQEYSSNAISWTPAAFRRVVTGGQTQSTRVINKSFCVNNAAGCVTQTKIGRWHGTMTKNRSSWYDLSSDDDGSLGDESSPCMCRCTVVSNDPPCLEDQPKTLSSSEAAVSPPTKIPFLAPRVISFRLGLLMMVLLGVAFAYRYHYQLNIRQLNDTWHAIQVSTQAVHDENQRLREQIDGWNSAKERKPECDQNFPNESRVARRSVWPMMKKGQELKRIKDAGRAQSRKLRKQIQKLKGSRDSNTNGIQDVREQLKILESYTKQLKNEVLALKTSTEIAEAAIRDYLDDQKKEWKSFEQAHRLQLQEDLKILIQAFTDKSENASSKDCLEHMAAK